MSAPPTISVPGRVALKNHSAIPRIIWQTYKTKALPVKGQLASDTWKSMNPGWEYRLWDDEQIAGFIESEFGGELATLFHSVPLGVMKADIWRYAILYKYGGVYSDIDTTCLVPLDWWEMTWEKLRVALEDQTHFCQWTIVAAPGHPVFEKVLELIVERGRDGFKTAYEHFVHWHTGPAVWTAGICASLGLPFTKAGTVFHHNRRQADAQQIQILPPGTFNGHLVSHAFGSKYYSKYDYVRWVDQRDILIAGGVASPNVSVAGLLSDETAKQPARYSLNAANARDICLGHLEKIPAASVSPRHRAILFCARDFSAFAGSWVSICMLRRLGCNLPIEIWHDGSGMVDASLESAVQALGVRCVDAARVREKHSLFLPDGMDLRACAALYCEFEEVLLLQEDHLPLKNPAPIFDQERFQSEGAICWPDKFPLARNNPIWNALKLDPVSEGGFGAGALLINKTKCWKPLHLSLLFNECGDFFNRYISGGKDAFYLSFRLLQQPFASAVTAAGECESGNCLADMDGTPLFQQRTEKWSVFGHNRSIQGFPREGQCMDFLRELRTILFSHWGSSRPRGQCGSSGQSEWASRLIASPFDFHRKGHDRRLMTFLPNGLVGLGLADDELFWNLTGEPSRLQLELFSYSSRTSHLHLRSGDRWEGITTIMSNEVQVELTPILTAAGD